MMCSTRPSRCEAGAAAGSPVQLVAHWAVHGYAREYGLVRWQGRVLIPALVEDLSGDESGARWSSSCLVEFEAVAVVECASRWDCPPVQRRR